MPTMQWLGGVAAGVDVADAGPCGWSRLQPCQSDRLSADLAGTVCAGADTFESSFDFAQVVECLVRHRRQLGSFVGDRLSLGIVFVIGIGVARSSNQGGHVVGELRSALAEGIAFLVQPGNGTAEFGPPTRAWSRSRHDGVLR